MWPIFNSVTRFSKCNSVFTVPPFFTVYYIFYSATRFLQYNSCFTVWPICFGVTIFLRCDPFYLVTCVSKCDLIFTVRPIFFFYSVTHFWPSLYSVTYFSKWEQFSQCDSYFKMWPISYSVTHFFHLWHPFPFLFTVSPIFDPCFTVWLILYRVTRFFQTCLIFLQCDLHF